MGCLITKLFIQENKIIEVTFIDYALMLLTHPDSLVTLVTFELTCTKFDNIPIKTCMDMFIMNILLNKISYILNPSAGNNQNNQRDKIKQLFKYI